MNFLRLIAAIFSLASCALGFASAGYIAYFVNNFMRYGYYGNNIQFPGGDIGFPGGGIGYPVDPNGYYGNSFGYSGGNYDWSRFFLFNDTPDIVAGIILGVIFLIHCIIQSILAMSSKPSFILRMIGITSTIGCLGSVVAIGAVSASSYYLHQSPYLPVVAIIVGAITIMLSFEWDRLFTPQRRNSKVEQSLDSIQYKT